MWHTAFSCLFDACCGRNIPTDTGSGVPSSDHDSSSDCSNNELYQSLEQPKDDVRFDQQSGVERGDNPSHDASKTDQRRLTSFPPFEPSANRDRPSILKPTNSKGGSTSRPSIHFRQGAVAAGPPKKDRGRQVHFDDLDRVRGGVQYGGDGEDGDGQESDGWESDSESSVDDGVFVGDEDKQPLIGGKSGSGV